MNASRYRRRELLKTIGSAALAMPLLHAGRASGAGFPRRLIIVQTTNGVIHPDFWPKTVDTTNFELDTAILKPLVPHKRDIILVGGLEMKAALDEKIPTAGGLGHHNLPHLLTGAAGASGRIPDGRTDPVGNSISVDQFIANALQKRTPTAFRSLELGVLVHGLARRGDNDGYISFNGPAIGSNPARPNGNSPEESPYKVYAKLAASAGQAGQNNALFDSAGVMRLQAQRKSTLDFISADLRRLQKNLGVEDRMKLETHLEGVRRLEAELGSPGAAAAGASCKIPNPDDAPKIDLARSSSMPAITKAQFDLIVAAMACGLTRVTTVMMCNGSNENLSMPWLGIDGAPTLPGYKVRDHHNVSHAPGPPKVRAENWFIEQFAYLINALKSVKEGDGTMLDNTVVWWANNMDNGAAHTCRGMPWILAGSCGGYFKTGRYVRVGDWGQPSYSRGTRFLPHNGLLVALCNAMEVPTETFGDAKYGGELKELRGG